MNEVPDTTQQVDPAQQPPPPTAGQQAASSGIAIEDDRAVLRTALHNRGADVATAQDPETALRYAEVCEKLANALHLIDPSLTPQKAAPPASGAQGGSGSRPKRTPS